MRMPSDHFSRDCFDYVAEGECIFFFRHTGVKHHLQQEIAEFIPEIVEIAAGDSIGDFIGLLDGVGRNGREILLEIPGAPRLRRSQRRHDFEQA